MKKFLLLSEKHENALKNFIISAAAAENEHFLKLLLDFLMDICELENPVYSRSAKMRTIAAQLRKTAVWERELRLLGEYMRTENEINIDGYTTFRMSEYREKLDLIAYRLAKRIKYSLF